MASGYVQCVNYAEGLHFSAFHSYYPARACASKGLCDRSWCLLYIYILLLIDWGKKSMVEKKIEPNAWAGGKGSCAVCVDLQAVGALESYIA